MTRTKSTYLALLAVLLSPMAANADVITITGAGANDGLWDITIVQGSFNSLTPLLMDQVWWEDDALALLFSDTLADLMGLPNDGSLGPYFAISDDDPRTTAGWYLLAAFAGGQASLWQDLPENVDRYFATATRVPEPGTLALLGIGLFGMGLARRKKV